MAKNRNDNYSYMTRRIGGTTYRVRVVFNDSAAETLGDKIFRIICNDGVTNGGTCGVNTRKSSRCTSAALRA